MIGGGGKVGGPPRGPVPVDNPEPTSDLKGPVVGKPQPRSLDKFEKSASGRFAAPGPAPAMSPERSGGTDVLKLVRDNPGQAKILVASMRAQLDKAMAKVQQEMAGARAVLEQLGAQKFAKGELDKRRAELRRRRESISALKMRTQLASRKMALLQQLAGRLGDPGLEEELDRILSQHGKLETEWGRRHHLLEIAELFYGGDDDTPEHLRDVITAEVRSGDTADLVGEAMQDVSPRRVIAELIARTLDGTMADGLAESDDASEAQQRLGAGGEHGRSLQTWTTLGDLMAASLGEDPFAPDE